MITPERLIWAKNRSNLFDFSELALKIGKEKSLVEAWIEGTSKPTLEDVDCISKKLHIRLVDLVSPSVPKNFIFENLVDFRSNKTISSIEQPSLELEAVFRDALKRQEWLSEYQSKILSAPLIKKEENSSVEKIAETICSWMNIRKLRETKDWADFLKMSIEHLWKKGVLVIRNGIVQNNTHRGLDIEEFKGFTLYDDYAPLIFINARDFKAAQIFTLYHEIAHLFLGENALDGDNIIIERKCNSIASRVLIHDDEMRNESVDEIRDGRIAKKYKVSQFVVLISAKRNKRITEEQFLVEWEKAKGNIKRATNGTSGQFYKTTPFRMGGDHFARAIFDSVATGNLLYKDAFYLTNLHGTTFKKYAKEKGYDL